MRFDRPIIVAALALALAACGQQPKPAELLTFEQLRLGETAQLVQDRQPELYAEAEAAYKKALLAHEDDEPEETLHYTRLADITWQTAVARSQLEDRQAALKAAQRDLATAEQARTDAQQRKTLAEDGIERQLRIIETQAQLAAAEAASKQVKRASDAKAKVDEAAARVAEAEAVDAARHAVGEFNKARAGLQMALQQFGAGDYKQAQATAGFVIADAQAAIAVAKPKWDVEQKMRNMEGRLRGILDAAASVPGAESRLEPRGAVITLRELFASGQTAIETDRLMAVQQTAKIARDFSEFRLIVEGHTDNRGRKARNLELSEQRARAVAGQIQGNGVDGGRITAIGRGDDEPIDDNSSRDGRARNRRVDVVFLRPTASEMAR